MKSKINTLLLIVGLGCIAALIANVIRNQPPEPEKWSVVCDGKGRYSFIKWNGKIALEDFTTHAAAEEAAKKDREWSAAYDARTDEKAIEKRQAAFAPCKES